MIASHLLELSDQRIAYAETSVAGADRTPVVLLHGGAVDRRMWANQMTGLGDRRVVAPDARGHGESSDAVAPYRLADDVVALLDALEIERAVLVGLSMGGGTAVDVALEHPGRVAGLVVCGTGTSEPEFTDPWCVGTFARWREAEQRGDLEGWIDAFMAFTAGPDRSREDVDPAVWDLVEQMARDTLAQHLQVDADGNPVPPVPPTPVTETWERLASIDVPVLALCGDDDGVDHRQMGRRLAREVERGTFVTAPGAHYPNLEDPQAFRAAVRTFLGGHDL